MRPPTTSLLLQLDKQEVVEYNICAVDAYAISRPDSEINDTIFRKPFVTTPTGWAKKLHTKE